MLWETQDPRRALEERFGFADGESAGRWVATVLHEHWGIRIRSCERIVISDRNALAWVTTASGGLLAKWSVAVERFPCLAQLSRLTLWLDGRGLPVSAPVPALDGRAQVEVDDVSMCLQHQIGGALLDPADPGEVRAAGAVLARLQDALADYPDADLAAGLPGASEPLTVRVTQWLDTRAEHVPGAARDTLRELVAAPPSDRLPMQPLHYDFRSANVLCADAEVAAVLDFEGARIDHRVVELARSAVLLGTRFHDWGPVPGHVHAAFRAGYESVRRLTAAEAAWFDILRLWHTLAFVPPGDDPTGWGPSASSLMQLPATA
jgi:homoserine kinase type II